MADMDKALESAKIKLGFSDDTLDDMARDGVYPIGTLDRMRASDILMAAADRLEKKSRLNAIDARGLRSIAANLRHGQIERA